MQLSLRSHQKSLRAEISGTITIIHGVNTPQAVSTDLLPCGLPCGNPRPVRRIKSWHQSGAWKTTGILISSKQRQTNLPFFDQYITDGYPVGGVTTQRAIGMCRGATDIPSALSLSLDQFDEFATNRRPRSKANGDSRQLN